MLRDFWDGVVQYAAPYASQEAMQELAHHLLLGLAVLAVAYVLIKLSLYALDRVLTRCFRDDSDTGLRRDVLKSARALVKTLVLYGGYFAALVVVLHIFDVRVIEAADLKDVGIKILKIAGILVGTRLLLNLGHLIVSQVFAKKEFNDALNSGRLRTLEPLVKNALTYAAFFVAGLTVLQVLNVNTSAILASAGILGLAVGFGAQNLVRDVISGFFIVFENQLAVGDYVEAAGVVGVVEETGLRTCKIRQWTGQLHIVPNGEITKVTNYNRGYMLAVVTVGIAYEEDIDRAITVLRQESERASREIEAVLEVPVVQGVVDLADSAVNIRTIARTRPGEQWNVERELRRRFKYALDQAGIEIPYPRMVVFQRQDNT
ncbi:mechanosensitive ion channel family protein [Desulforudis sp. 1088]|uniref:mechanosensitive ion channel family protein n=1 Tax=unclassified Candidatus Desulforudis TaxID=2635950 RepID=UPI00347DED9A